MPPPATPLVAIVLPPREGFGPGRSGAIGLLTRRLARTPGFDTIVIGGRQAGPVFPEITYRPVRPALWPPGSTNIRYAAAVARALKPLNPALIEVIGRKRPKGEVPHDLGGGIRIVGVDEREGQARDVILEAAVGAERNLWRISLGRFLVGWRPLKMSSRNYFHRHALPDQDEVPGTDQVRDL